MRKIFYLLFLGCFTGAFSQIDSINLRQKLIKANFKNINAYIVNNKGSFTTSGDYDSNELDILAYSAETNSTSGFGSDLYTGMQDIKIPLFSVREGNITIPITLVYQTSGIKVDQKASEVGLGWSLMTVPVIKRKVNIVNDWYEKDNPKKPNGYFRKTRENLPIISQNLYVAESSPDEYYTTLKGDRKKFIFLNENIASELTKTGIKIQAQSYNFPNFSSYQPKDFNQFEITDNDGLVYKFIDAGFKSAYGESMELVTQGSSQIDEEITVSDWKTSKITDVLNNTSVNIEYIINPKNQLYSTISENSSVQFGSNTSSNISYERNIPPGNQARWPYVVSYVRTLLSEKKYVSKIIHSKGFVKFNYEEMILNYDNAPGFEPLPTFSEYVLKSIEAYDNQNKLIKKYTFNYGHFNCIERQTDLDLCAQRVKLASIEESGKGKYEFTYNSLPLYSYTSNKYDYLGYHTDADINDNGKGLYYYPYQKEWSILPYNLPIPPYDPIQQTSDLQKIKIFNNDQTSYSYQFKLKALPFSNYAKAGILEKIKFPTGGEQNFEYEPNDFLVFNKFEVQGAGLRIKEITLKDMGVVQKRTKYDYKDPITNKSSGLMIAPPFLGYPKMYYDLGGDFTEIMDEEHSTVSNYFSLYNKSNFNDGSDFVGYGRVTKKYEDGSSEEFVFKNKNDDYDLTSLNYSTSIILPGVPQDFSYGSFKNWNSASLIKYKNFGRYGNGNLLEKYIYNKTGTMVEKIVNNYRNNFSNALESDFPYYTPPNVTGKWTYGAYKMRYITYFNDLISTTKTNYFSSGNISETINYNYIDNFSDKIRSITKGNGVTIERKYLFDGGFAIGTPEANLQYQYNNIYALESETTKLNAKILDKKGIKYGNYIEGATIVPRVSEIYNETLNGATNKSTKIISYTSKGHIKETISNELSITTIWGYNDNYPIAEIVGATYSQVENYISDIVNKSNLDKDEVSENILLDSLDTFRKNANLSNFQITTYTYNPLIGITSITPPSGMREIYIYDDANRLKEVKRQEKDSSGNFIYRTLSENEYHYKPQI